VLAAATDTTGLKGLIGDGSRMGHIANGPLYPVEEAPMILTTKGDVASDIIPIKKEPLTFAASSIIYPTKFRQLRLVPFFQLHDTRYTIYWPVTSPQKLAARQQSLRSDERGRLALEKQTIDQVAPGEQQPESDHNFKGEGSESGVFNDRHWRHASGWFSYDLKDRGKEGRKLRITYFGGDSNRHFDIYINNTILTTVTLDGSGGDKFFDVDYNLPEDLMKGLPDVGFTLRFAAHPGSVAGGVYYVRLLK
jgi:hypothetical protein